MKAFLIDMNAELVIRTRAYRTAKSDLAYANSTSNKAWRQAAFRQLNVARSELQRVVRDTRFFLGC